MSIIIFIIVVLLLSLGVLLLAAHNHKFAPILCLIGIVYVRGFEHLGPDVGIDNDSHRYFLSAESVLKTHQLRAPQQYELAWSIVERKVQLFIYPVLTASISIITDIVPEPTLRILIPLFISVILFFLAWSIARLYLPESFAISTAYFYMMMDSLIRHHTIYHQQAIGTVFVLFLFFCILRGTQEEVRKLYLLPALLLPVTHSGSVYFALVPLGMLLTLNLLGHLIKVDITSLTNRIEPQALSLIVLISTIFILSFFLYKWTFSLYGMMHKLATIHVADNPAFTAGKTLTGYKIQRHPTIIDQSSLITKFVLSIAAVPGFLLAIKGNKGMRQVYSIGIVLGIFGVFGTVAYHPAVFGRITKFGYLFAIIGASGGLYYYRENVLNKRSFQIILIVVIALLIAGNSLQRVEPSRIDYSTDISADEYYHLRPIGSQLPLSGYWVRKYTPEDALVYTITTTRPAGFHWGLRETVSFVSTKGDGYGINDIRRFPEVSNEQHNKLYSNGPIVIGYWDRS